MLSHILKCFSIAAILWGLEWLSIGAFLVSLAALRTGPRLSVPSITGRTPGSESL